jgi:hypothetical protein
MRIAFLRVTVPAFCLCLAACGGGGGTRVVLTEPPPPTPTAFPLTTTGSFNTITADRQYQLPPTGITVSKFGVAGSNSGLTISYNAANGTYTVQNSATSATLGAGDRSSNTYLDVYSKQSGTATDALTLFSNVRSGASQSGAPVQLTYLSYGSWSHDDSSTGDHRDTYFLIGYPTTPSQMPLSGSATYSTAVTANLVSVFPAQGESSINGSATFTANFGTATVDTQLTLLTPAQNLIGTYLGTSPIAGSTFGGTLTSSDDPYLNSGSFAGGFFGPNAKEMGYTFSIDRGVDDPYAGTTALPGRSWIVGAVVGTKN